MSLCVSVEIRRLWNPSWLILEICQAVEGPLGQLPPNLFFAPKNLTNTMFNRYYFMTCIVLQAAIPPKCVFFPPFKNVRPKKLWLSICLEYPEVCFKIYESSFIFCHRPSFSIWLPPIPNQTKKIQPFISYALSRYQTDQLNISSTCTVCIFFSVFHSSLCFVFFVVNEYLYRSMAPMFVQLFQSLEWCLVVGVIRGLGFEKGLEKMSLQILFLRFLHHTKLKLILYTILPFMYFFLEILALQGTLITIKIVKLNMICIKLHNKENPYELDFRVF